jgi:hypothetical protein
MQWRVGLERPKFWILLTANIQNLTCLKSNTILFWTKPSDAMNIDAWKDIIYELIYHSKLVCDVSLYNTL